MTSPYIKKYTNKYTNMFLNPSGTLKIFSIPSYNGKEYCGVVDNKPRYVMTNYLGTSLFIIIAFILLYTLWETLDNSDCIQNKTLYKIFSTSILFIAVILWQYIFSLFITFKLIMPVLREGEKYKVPS